jgi:hypothetical protein
MDFSPILNSVSTQDQVRELIAILDKCSSVAFTTKHLDEVLAESVSHEYFTLMKPIMAQKNWQEIVIQLRNQLTQLPVVTLYTPYVINQKTAQVVCDYIRSQVIKDAVVDVVQKKSSSPLSIEWQGHYGEF